MKTEIVQRDQDKKELRKIATRILRLSRELLEIEAVDIHVSFEQGEDAANDCLSHLLQATQLSLKLSGMSQEQISAFIYLHSQKKGIY